VSGGRFVMASRVYCESIAEELGFWSNRLHELSNKFDRVPSINKYKLLPQIEELHILMTEMDDHLCDMMNACPTVETLKEEEIRLTS
jgi:hypothetical protein